MNRLFRPRPQPLLRLVFASRQKVAPERLADEVDEIVRASLKRNAESAVTGLLLPHAGYYLQVLEGPSEAVLATYVRIRHDPRHCTVKVLHNGSAPIRELGDWTMSALAMKPAGLAVLAALGQQARFEPYRLSGSGVMQLFEALGGIRARPPAHAAR